MLAVDRVEPGHPGAGGDHGDAVGEGLEDLDARAAAVAHRHHDDIGATQLGRHVVGPPRREHVGGIVQLADATVGLAHQVDGSVGHTPAQPGGDLGDEVARRVDVGRVGQQPGEEERRWLPRGGSPDEVTAIPRRASASYSCGPIPSWRN